MHGMGIANLLEQLNKKTHQKLQPLIDLFQKYINQGVVLITQLRNEASDLSHANTERRLKSAEQKIDDSETKENVRALPLELFYTKSSIANLEEKNKRLEHQKRRLQALQKRAQGLSTEGDIINFCVAILAELQTMSVNGEEFFQKLRELRNDIEPMVMTKAISIHTKLHVVLFTKCVALLNTERELLSQHSPRTLVHSPRTVQKINILWKLRHEILDLTAKTLDEVHVRKFSLLVYDCSRHPDHEVVTNSINSLQLLIENTELLKLLNKSTKFFIRCIAPMMEQINAAIKRAVHSLVVAPSFSSGVYLKLVAEPLSPDIKLQKLVAAIYSENNGAMQSALDKAVETQHYVAGLLQLKNLITEQSAAKPDEIVVEIFVAIKQLRAVCNRVDFRNSLAELTKFLIAGCQKEENYFPMVTLELLNTNSYFEPAKPTFFQDQRRVSLDGYFFEHRKYNRDTSSRSNPHTDPKL